MKLTDICFQLVVVALFCTSLGFAQQQSEPPERGDMIRRRMEWFYKQRAYPLKHIPAGARLRALKQLDRMLADEARSATPNADVSSETAFAVSSAAISSTRWTLIGPEPTSTPYNVPVVAGRVTALAVDPTNSNVVYAGAADGGVWKTTDGGVHWTPLTDTQPSLAVGSIAIDPANHSTIYVGTGEENFSADSYYGAGILKSTNGGSSWTQIKGPFAGYYSSDGQYFFGGAAHIGGIAIQPGNSAVMLVAVEMSQDTNIGNTTGIYRTEDGGITWTPVLSGDVPSQPFFCGTAVLFDPSNANIAYAATDSDAAVYKSLDAGKTWAHINGTGSNVLPSTNLGRIALAIAPSNPSTLYAGIQDTSTFGLLGLFKTTDGGANWVKLVNTPDYCAQQCWYDQAIAVAPNNANVVFVGGAYGSFVYRSMDGGSHWTDVTQGANGFYLHADMHALAFSADSSILYAGNDGGVWSASPPTATPVPWTELNDALAITQFYFSPSINPKDVANSLGGTQDNGTQKYSGVLTWDDVVCGDGGWTAIDPVTPSNVYSSCYAGNGLVWKSIASGVPGSWTYAATGINVGEEMEFLPPLAIDALHPTNLYLGTYRVYQTTNNAGNWTTISGDLTNGQPLTTIAVAPTNSNTVYVGTGNGLVQVTTNALAGAVWNNRSTGLPQLFITQIVVDPHASTTAYLAFSGFNFGHVFRTTDGGLTWNDISGNLPNIPVNAIVVDPVLANTYYVATDIGVFGTRNGGGIWSTLGAGLPRVTVLGLTLHNASRTLRASTHGRSMWDLAVPLPNATLSPTSLTFSTQAIGTTSAAKKVTLTNVGTTTLSISGIAITGTNAGDFAQTHTCGSSLAAGANCTISVTFKPTASGTRTAAVSITDNAAGSPQKVTLSGIGTTAKLSPISLSFGSVAIGTTSPAKTVTLTNMGTTSLTITSIAITGTNPGDFAQTHTCGSSLAAGASCSISVRFKPTASGTRTAALSVSDNAAGSPQKVTLSGIGTTAKLSPTSLTFSTQAIGTTSPAKTVTLTNVGTTSFSIAGIAITGTNPGDFAQTHTCGSSLAAGASCSISVRFKPTASGTRTAALSVSDNAAGSPQKVSLSGIGTTAKLSPTSLNFGSIVVGTTSPANTVTLTNVGTTTLSISNITITGTNAGDFAQTHTCGSSLGAGASCSISVTFTPTAIGTRVAAVSITDNAAGSPQKVALSGSSQNSAGRCVVSGGFLTGSCLAPIPGLPIGRCGRFSDTVLCPPGQKAISPAFRSCTNLGKIEVDTSRPCS